MRTRWRWWLQGVVFALLTAAAFCVVWAQISPGDSVSRYVRGRLGWRIPLGLDIQGGLRLGYTIDMSWAIAQEMDKEAAAIEIVLHSEPGWEDARVNRDGDDIVIQTPRLATAPYSLDRLLRPSWEWLEVVERNSPPGTVRLCFDESRWDDMRSRYLPRGRDTLLNRCDGFHDCSDLIYFGSRW